MSFFSFSPLTTSPFVITRLCYCSALCARWLIEMKYAKKTLGPTQPFYSSNIYQQRLQLHWFPIFGSGHLHDNEPLWTKVTWTHSMLLVNWAKLWKHVHHVRLFKSILDLIRCRYLMQIVQINHDDNNSSEFKSQETKQKYWRTHKHSLTSGTSFRKKKQICLYSSLGQMGL